MPSHSAIEHPIGGEWRNHPDDRVIAAVAERQHGIVGRAQLLELGIRRRSIEHRLKRGRLHPLHRGVYAVGHRLLTKEGWWMAAVLSGGPGAVLSQRSAAALWQIRPTARSQVEVTTPRKLRTLPNLLPHCAVLPADEITSVAGIPVTTLARTLLDLAGAVNPVALKRAVNEAERRRLGSTLSPAEMLDRYPRKPGAPALRRLLLNFEPTITRSELEDRFHAFLDDIGLPRPDGNTVVEGMEVDIAWRERRLIVELDGFDIHGTRQAFEDDRTRDRRLQVAGWRVIRITWRQLHEGQQTLARELHTLLAEPTATPPDPPSIEELTSGP